MREILIAFGMCVLLAGGAVLARSASALQLIYAGSILIAGGMVFSLPCAIWYHYKLYTTLHPRGDLAPRWIWNPTGQHVRLRAEERPRVLPWFYAGAAGWTICMLGCVLLGLAAWVERVR
jgi:hypothetical protein